MRTLFCLLFILCPLLNLFPAEESVPQHWSWELSGDRLQIRLNLPQGYYAYPEETEPVLTPYAVPLVRPVPRRHRDPLLDAEVNVYHGPGNFVWEYAVSSLRFPLSAAVKWQICREGKNGGSGICLMPGQKPLIAFDSLSDLKQGKGVQIEAEQGQDDPVQAFLLPDYVVERIASGYLSPDEMIAFIRGTSGPSVHFTGRSFLLSLLLALLGGLALNLTPCVLPLIPVNLAVIGAGMDSERPKRGKIFRGLFYGAGITVAYGILGVIAVLTGAAFGEMDSSWLFNLGAAVIFVILGCAMFDLFRIDFSGAAGRFRMPSAARLGGVFLLGALSALLAGACVAPVIAAALVQASGMAAAGNYAGLLLPFLVGLGMALPWPFAAAGLSLFPKPGAWMNHVKHILGVLILLLAVYYFWTAGSLLLRKDTVPGVGQAQAYAQIRTALEESEKTSKPVLLDFGASWCKACRLTEVKTFPDPDVKEALKDVILVRIQAEKPSDPATAELLKRFQVKGMPTFLLIRPETPTKRK